jgi:branched-chain amino acid transport system permease protein
MVIIGGMASHRGAFLGAVIMVALPEALRFLGAPPEYAAQLRQIIYGLILVLLMIFRPKGILGKYRL